MLPHYDAFGAKLIARCDTARLLADYAFYFKSNYIDVTSTSVALAAGVMSRCSPSLQDRISLCLIGFLRDVASGADEDWDEAMLWAWMCLGTVAQHGYRWDSAARAHPFSLLVVAFIACSSEEASLQIHPALTEIGNLPKWKEVLHEDPELAEKSQALTDICTRSFAHRPSLRSLVDKWREIASGFDPLSGLTTDDAEAAGWMCLEWACTQPPHGK